MAASIADRMTGYREAQRNGVGMPRRGRINFEGTGVSVRDDEAGQATVVRLTSGIAAETPAPVTTTSGGSPTVILTLDVPPQSSAWLEISLHGCNPAQAYLEWYFSRTWCVRARRPGTGAVVVEAAGPVVAEQSIEDLEDTVVVTQGLGGQLGVVVHPPGLGTLQWAAKVRVLSAIGW